MIETTETKINIPNHLPQLIGDEKLLRQMFQNLLSNIIKFSKPNKIVHIRIKEVKSTNNLIIEIEDNGRGIDPKYHDRIFEIFTKFHTYQDDTGRGIGLVFCKEIMKLHNGQIEINSAIGNGSTFSLIFPKKDHQSA